MEPNHEMLLDEVPHPPLFKLVDGSGRDVFEHKEISGKPSTLGALFPSGELAAEFSENAAEFGLEAMAGLEVRELPDWKSVEDYAAAGEEYILVVAERATGLFFAEDVAQRAVHAVREKDAFSFPLYMFSDEKGEAPLISLDDPDGPLLVATLFSSPENARKFREKAAHLELPGHLGTIEDAEGLSRHALIARQAGADYAVVDPEAGMTEAIPIQDFIL